ncbi:hypothetical protein LPJ61_000617 [Coemansia biformis]|uniref:Vacuolar protein 14 C-terminal Fig4-binding domain-containing protein n=1 Tax=Coemansia biformis TaxID=1286918 RepID=A0A9W7YIC1_9FUNG|nr:hypothetical protein LPJ61_000617 [Coemansia biformis]
MLSITATRSESPEEVTVETTQTDADAAANVVDGPEAGAATEAMTAVEDIAPAGGEQVGNTAEMEEVVEEPFNYEYAATSIMELFAKNVHEPTKVAGMHWLLLLHRKAPWRILTPDDMSFPVLLKMLGDSSEQVVKLDLELFAQISQHARGSDSLAPLSAGYNVNPQDVPYLSRFLGSFDDGHGVAAGGDVFSIGGNEDSDAEEEGDESSDSAEDGPNDLEFVSVMVQHLSWILVTAPEAEPLRMMLRRFNAAITLSMPVLPALRLMLFGPSPLIQLAKLAKLPRGPATGGGVPKPLALPRAGATGASATRGRSSTADSERARAKADASVRSGGRRPIPPVQRQGEQTEQQQQQRKERTREALVGAMDHVERRVAQNQQSHELFATLFRTWSHNPAACLTLCLLSQHYEMAAELIGIFGQLPQDLTVSFLVQLDKLVQLIESPVFAYLRLQFGGAGARQLHYHYHYHNHGIAHRATVGSAADQTRAGAQLNNALGVPPSEVAELVRQLAACGQSPTTMFLGPDSDDYDGAADAASLLRELAELNLGRAPADEPADSDADGDAGMSGYPAASTHGAETDLLNQYRAVRRHHAIARQKAGQST